MKQLRKSFRSKSKFKLHEIDRRATLIGGVSHWKGHVESVTMERGDTFRQTGEAEPSLYRTFHRIITKKCFVDEPLAIPLDEIQIDNKLHFVEEPVEIKDREVKWLKQSRIPIVKVRWNSIRGPEFTWEREDQMKKKYPHLFANPSSTS
ncbi:hypothetical protein Tco_0218975 [Tanacetum coccineum]